MRAELKQAKEPYSPLSHMGAGGKELLCHKRILSDCTDEKRRGNLGELEDRSEEKCQLLACWI